MSKNINDASLANLKHFEGKWRHGQTCTIRVPIALADRILALARQLDNSELLDTLELPDAAYLLNRLRMKRKRSRAELADIQAILELLAQTDFSN